VNVPEYWIVDLERKVVEVWTPEAQFPRVERERTVWTPSESAEQLTIELQELFAPL